MAPLSYDDMKALSANKPANTFIFDVRGTDEVKSSGIIPGAVNVPLDQMDAAAKSSDADFTKTFNSAKPAKSDRVVTYCMRGMRAENAANILTSNGYTNVDVYPGSWMEWSSKQ